MTPPPLDFRKPPPGDLERQAGGWFALAARKAAAIWPKVLSYPAAFKPGPVEAVPAAVLRALPDDTLAVPVGPPAAADGLMLLAVRRPLLLALLAGLLGETPAALPDDRDPTDLEASLVGYLARALVLDPLERGWPAAEPLRLTAGAPGTPRAAWAGPPADMILRATWTVSAPYGDHPLELYLSKAGRWARLAQPAAAPPTPEPADRERIEALVREMAVDLAVVLGEAVLTMAEVAALKTGDVLVLRQKVSDPLAGLVAGERKFRVWPGAVGGKAAVQIHAPNDD